MLVVLAENNEPYEGDAGDILGALLAEADLTDIRLLTDVEEACRATYLLLLGKDVLARFQSGVKISQARGRPFLLGSTRTQIGDRLCMPTYHPSYLLRVGTASKAAEAVRSDLRGLRELSETNPQDWLHSFPDTCVLCDEYATQFAEDGWAWCENHRRPDGQQ